MLSEGRGTTRPFEAGCASGIDWRRTEDLNAVDLNAVDLNAVDLPGCGSARPALHRRSPSSPWP
ncbi:hypothetical protein [Actinosynnema sp. NPDC023587]|uniref:hypothetical protein n=1 Tax=Actinosynnema sp. NPDC023587 TaxID=3154695 RepID=UPI0033E97866